MALFEPPKYLTSLIASVNDGAKAAQAGALGLAFVGLFLVATALSVTDEDLLLQRTAPISQIGVQLPVVFSFAIAPAIFLFLHVYTLIRYDLLAANLSQFRDELENTVPLSADRQRCRQLLANVEFVQAWVTPRASAVHSRFYSFVAWAVLAGFPVTTLILVQVSSLRYQSDIVARAQQLWLALDLALLIWFFHRQWRYRRFAKPKSRYGMLLHWGGHPAVAVLILALDLVYVNPPPSHAREQQIVRREPLWSAVHKQPLDFVSCPALRFGCRYLRFEQRLLIGRVWNQQAVAELKARSIDAKKSLAGIDGLELNDRSLRFAVFYGSRLYAASIFHSDLSGAGLSGADLSGASLIFVELPGANLSGTSLVHATLYFVDLSNVDLAGADLFGADLYEVDVSGSDLSKAKNITQEQLKDVCGNEHTKLPSGLTVSVCPE